MKKSLTKSQAIKRVARLVELFKLINCSNCPEEFSIEVENCELEIKILENEMSLIIDNYMSNKFENYNSIKRREIITQDREHLLSSWKAS